MDFHGVKRNNKQSYPPAVAEQRRLAWDKIKEGSPIKTSLSVPRKSKSYAQVKLIWGNMVANTILQSIEKGICVDDLLRFLLVSDIPSGVAIDEDFIHTLMYIIAPTTDESGKKITLSKMNTVQASSLFKRYCQIMDIVGIHIEPPPEIQDDKES